VLPVLPVLPSRSRHIRAVLFDQISDVRGALACVRTNVSDCAAKPNVVTDQRLPVGALDLVVHVSFLHPETTVVAPSIVRLVAIGHDSFSCVAVVLVSGDRSVIQRLQFRRKEQADRPPVSRSGQPRSLRRLR